MPVRTDLGGLTKIASSSQTIAANSTVAFDFGTPDDIDLRNLSGYKAGSRVLVFLSAKRAAGTTSTLTFSIQDAPDSNGSIGTPAAAVVAGTVPTFGAASGAIDQAAAVGVVVQPGRAWLRVNAIHAGGGTDSFQAHCAVFSVPDGL